MNDFDIFGICILGTVDVNMPICCFFSYYRYVCIYVATICELISKHANMHLLHTGTWHHQDMVTSNKSYSCGWKHTLTTMTLSSAEPLLRGVDERSRSEESWSEPVQQTVEGGVAEESGGGVGALPPWCSGEPSTESASERSEKLVTMDSRFFCSSVRTSKGEGVVECINTAEEQQCNKIPGLQTQPL